MPRRSFYTLVELAALLSTNYQALYRYLDPAGPGRWRLKPLDEVAYER